MKRPEWFTVDGLREKWREMVIPSWLVSVIVHTIALVILSFLFMEPPTATVLEDLETELASVPEQPNLDEIQIDPLPLEPPQTMDVPAPEEPTVASVAMPDAAVEAAPLSPVDMPPLDNMANLLSGINPSGSAAKGAGGLLNSRGSGMKAAMVGSQGGTKQTEHAVHAGLDWLLRHQWPDGHWSLHDYPCKQGRCSGAGKVKYDMAGTAFGLLPFLAANYTHKDGPYQKQVRAGLTWMIANQDKQTGSLAKESNNNMYVHGLASIVLAEAYALTGDNQVGQAAQAAIRFIEYAQHPDHGGWRYVPKQNTGDTSVVGWQLMALKSAQMGGLKVNPATFDGAKKFLKSVSFGSKGGRFGYDRPGGGSPAMTAVGLLCQQYLGALRSDEAIREGVDFLKANPPSMSNRNCYYWYYATQVMHNMQGAEWDRWNREMRTVWVESQEREKGKCEHGSWDPDKPTKDRGHTEVGGRVMITSIGLLTLEVYYRYLPLYKAMGGEAEVASNK
jgi:hypothetical protein